MWGWGNNIALGKGNHQGTVYSDLTQSPVPCPGPTLGVLQGPCEPQYLQSLLTQVLGKHKDLRPRVSAPGERGG